MTRLIVTADDLGLHRGMNLGAIEAHEKGIVTACSVVANGVELDHAVELLRVRSSSLDVGAHLCFVEERPLLPAESVASLVGSDGRFHRNFKAFYLRYQLGRIDMDQLRAELRTQVETLLSKGLSVVHLNGHQHLHLLPKIFEITQGLAEEFKIGWVRIANEQTRGSLLRRASISALNFYAKDARLRARTKHADRTIGISEAGHLDEAKLLDLFSKLEGTIELVVHPGRDDAALSAAYDWGYEWDAETNALCSQKVKQALTDAGVDLTAISSITS